MAILKNFVAIDHHRLGCLTTSKMMMNSIVMKAEQDQIRHATDTSGSPTTTMQHVDNSLNPGQSGMGAENTDTDLVSTSKAFYVSLDDNPNMIVFTKLERILDKMQDEKIGVPIRTVKTFMTKIPSVFTGQDLVAWLMTNMDLSEAMEALALANRMASFGYFFPIDDHVLAVKNDNTYYRFQVGSYCHAVSAL